MTVGQQISTETNIYEDWCIMGGQNCCIYILILNAVQYLPNRLKKNNVNFQLSEMLTLGSQVLL